MVMIDILQFFSIPRSVLDQMAAECNGDQEQIKQRLYQEYNKAEHEIKLALQKADQCAYTRNYDQKYADTKKQVTDLYKAGHTYLTKLEDLVGAIEELSMLEGHIGAAKKSNKERERIVELWAKETSAIQERRVLYEEMIKTISEPNRRGRPNYLGGLEDLMYQMILLYETVMGRAFTILEHRVKGEPQPVTEGQRFAYQALPEDYTNSNFQTACVEALKRARKRHSE